MTDHLNVEIKAKTNNIGFLQNKLEEMGANYKGCDHQIDTYFHCENGRLKLREGKIENSLIFYQRSNQKGPKDSHVSMTTLSADSKIGEVLKSSYGVKVVVDKKRHIYFIDNVKFHVDEVEGLGSFAEIEAIDYEGNIGQEKLLEQCQHYQNELLIGEDDLVDCSYSDLLFQN
jgi:adenylate cyclase, class 2